uniref:SCP domain-containing protein n=1 Tax=Plectus sambesii TaxID=2011161 RepID=A0A914WHC9_9BILA
MGAGFAPPAKNMYKLTWDCALEATAQKWADTCLWKHSDRSVRNGSGENLFMQGGGRPTNSDLLKSAASGWWGELTKFGIPTNDVTLTSALFQSGVGHFTQMAWATTKSIGCGVSKCKGGQTAHVVCHYGPSGNWINQPIYEIGSSCKKNSDCMGDSSACSVDEGLCIWK